MEGRSEFFLTPDGTTLAATQWSGERGTPVVLVHGGAQTRWAWTEVATRLNVEGWSTITFDLRGHGESSRTPHRYSPDHLVDDLLSVVDRVGGSANLVGASLGGLISILAAGRHGAAVRSLTLLDVVPNNNPLGESRIHNFLRDGSAGFASLKDVAAAVGKYHHEERRETAGLARYVRRGKDGLLRWHWDPDFLFPSGVPWTRLHRLEIEKAARQVRQPTLLLVGERSDLVGPAERERFLEVVPHAEVEVVLGAHHMISGDRNGVYSTGISKFLASGT